VVMDIAAMLAITILLPFASRRVSCIPPWNLSTGMHTETFPVCVPGWACKQIEHLCASLAGTMSMMQLTCEFNVATCGPILQKAEGYRCTIHGLTHDHKTQE